MSSTTRPAPVPDPMFPAPFRGVRQSFGRATLAVVLAVLLGTLLLLLAGLAHAQAPDASSATDDTLDGLRKQVDTATQQLRDPDKLGDAELQRLRSAMAAAQSQSLDIADSVAPQLGSVEARAAQLGTPAAGVKEDPDLVSQRTLLAKSRGQLDAQVKLARLLSVESAQLIGQIETLRRSQFQARLGERTDSVFSAVFWKELRENWPTDARRIEAFGADLATALRGVPWGLWLGVAGALAVIGAVPRLARARVLKFLSTRVPSGRLRRSLHAFVALLRWMLSFGAVGVALGLVLGWSRTLPPATADFVSHVAGMLWFSGFFFGLATALISARRPSWRLLPIPDAVALRLRRFPLSLTVVTFVTWLAERLATLVNASLAFAVAVNGVVALAVGLTVGLAMMRAERLWRLDLAHDASGPRRRPVWLMAAAWLNWLVLAAGLMSLLVGYVAFGSFAIRQIVWSAFVLGAAYLLAALIDDALMAWLGSAQHAEGDADRPADSHGPADATAARAMPSYAQFAVLLSGVLRLVLMLFALMLLLAPFGDGPADLLRRSDQWREGISIGQVSLQPGAVIQAIAVLTLGIAAIRWLRRWLENRYLPTTSLDPGMRASATSLFGYAGVVIAVALAMSALGIGLERIAWVASALSVGIGFGLQAVVQNFVSGLILLAERPVKVGDWVSLGGVEGDIRRINVRATEIQMGDRSTVIVPNSEFITKVVRNVTLADPLGLVQVKLPVPLGSDPERVRQLLLEAFTANTDVLDTPAPGVALDGIENAQLQFTATGFVKSPRLSGGVKSDLLFDVLARVKAAGIQLSAPPTMVLGAAAAGEK